MRIHFLGATRQVTGSRFLVETHGIRFGIDCGLVQERAFLSRNWDACPVDPGTVDALLLTHAHLDHVGWLPRLVAHGYRGRVHATAPSIDLAGVVLEDAAAIQEEDAAHKRKRHERERRRGPHPEVPLYTRDDVDDAMRLMSLVQYGKPLTLAPEVTATFHDAGHILGSAMIELRAGEKRVIFSGDIGEWDRPLLHDPTLFDAADAVVMESTYGDRDREDPDEDAIEAHLERIVRETAARGGHVVIPTFAIDRAQQLLYHFSRLANARRIPRLTVYIDSPMAIDATTIYKRFRHLLDEEAQRMFESGQHPFQFPGVHFVRNSQESARLNTLREPSIILAGSGMCTGGRIKHHLRHNLERPESTILFVGYQSEGTLGRQIVRGDPEVRIHGRMFTVRCRIESLQGLSAHADRAGLLRWLRGFRAPPRKLVLVHGEAKAMESFAGTIRAELGIEARMPEYRETIEI